MEFLACNTCSHHLPKTFGKNNPYEPNGQFLAEKQLFAWVYVAAPIICVKKYHHALTFWHIMTSASHLGSASGGSSSCVWNLKNYIALGQFGFESWDNTQEWFGFCWNRLLRLQIIGAICVWILRTINTWERVGILRTAVHRTESTHVVMLLII